MKRYLILFLGLASLASSAGQAAPIPIGALSFDVFIPPENGSPGVNAFNIPNFTSIFDLPPDFPSSTALTLMNTMLTVNPGSGPPKVILLEDTGPGPLLDPNGNPLPVLQFSRTLNFTSASITAAPSPNVFLLSTGSTFDAAPSISETLSPSSGSFFVAGVDSAVITAQPASTILEPGTLIPFGTAVGRSSAANP
jgi:hypothetical protein